MFLEKVESDYLNTEYASGRIGISLIGQSRAAASLRRMVQLSASTDAPLLLSGPEGAGKRDIAATIHARTKNFSAGFLSLNCSSLGKQFKKVDRFSSAVGGTAYFRLLEELPKSSFNVLFQLIEDGQMRVICGTRKSSDALIKEHNLPFDFAAAVSVLTLPVVPLAQRREDIPLLFEAHVHQLPKDRRFTLTTNARKLVGEYDWPGNFAEMHEMVRKIGSQYGGERLNEVQLSYIINARSTRLPHRAASFNKAPNNEIKPGFDLNQHIANEEIKHIRQALNQSDGVVKKAAEMTGIKRTTLIAKMKKYGLWS